MTRVIQVLEATTGGTRRHLHDLLHGLNLERFQVAFVYSPLRDPAFVKEDLPAYRRRGINLYPIVMQRRPAPLSDTRALRSLTHCFRLNRPDVVHAHSSKAGWLARLAARRAKVPCVVYSPHGFAFEMECARVLRLGYRLLERLAAQWTDVCICLCEHERRLALEQIGFAPASLRLIPNGVEPYPQANAPTRRPHNPAEPVIGFVGRLCRQKGPDLLTDAAPAIWRHCPGARLRFVGDGPLRESLRRRLSAIAPASRWQLQPAVDADTARDLAQSVDLLVMPSRWEGLPYVLLDALAAGTPVVAAAVGGIPEVLTDGQNGLLVPAGNPSALATAVIRLLQDAPLRAAIAEAGPCRAADFSLANMINNVEAVYAGSAATPFKQGA